MKTCDNASVGVLISDQADRWLMLTRATPPPGVAPAAGHVFDDHAVRGQDGQVDEAASYRAAAVAEVAEELGLSVDPGGLRLVASGWRTNACRRAAGALGPGHEWRIYQAETVSGTLAPSVRETRAVQWLTRAELQELANRTVTYSTGGMSDADFAAAPGIEAVWCRWLADVDLVALHLDDLDAIEQMLHTHAQKP